jgi:DNA polymerase elongation subunit (family B)
MVIEVLTASREGLTSDPKIDPVLAIAYALRRGSSTTSTVLFWTPPPRAGRVVVPNASVLRVASERALFDKFVRGGRILFLTREAEVIRGEDPDILVGFEIQKGSLGYLRERAGGVGVAFDRALSRCPLVRSIAEMKDDAYGRFVKNSHDKGTYFVINSVKIYFIEGPFLFVSRVSPFLCFFCVQGGGCVPFV